MSSAVSQNAYIDQKWVDSRRREEKPFFERLSDYVGKTGGAARILQLLKGVSGIAKQTAPNAAVVASHLEASTGAALGSLGLVRLPGAIKEAASSIHQLSQEDDAPVKRKITIAFRDTMGVVTASGSCASFVTQNPSFRNVAQFTGLAGDVSDLVIIRSDYNKASEHESVAEGEMKRVFAHTRYNKMLNICKTTVSIAAGILGLVMFLTGMKLVSAIAMIILSLSTTLLAIRADLHKEEGEFPIVSFDRPMKV